MTTCRLPDASEKPTRTWRERCCCQAGDTVFQGRRPSAAATAATITAAGGLADEMWSVLAVIALLISKGCAEVHDIRAVMSGIQSKEGAVGNASEGGSAQKGWKPCLVLVHIAVNLSNSGAVSLRFRPTGRNDPRHEKISLPHAAVLAPMSGVTDMPFRRAVRRAGGGLVVTEMVASAAILRQVKSEMRNCEPTR